MKLRVRFLSLAALAATAAFAQRQPPTPAQAMTRQFTGIHTKILAMVKDFPEDKFDYRPSKDVRSFKEVAVHILGGTTYAANAAKDPAASWDEPDIKSFKSKADVVAAYEKAIADTSAALTAVPEANW